MFHTSVLNVSNVTCIKCIIFSVSNTNKRGLIWSNLTLVWLAIDWTDECIAGINTVYPILCITWISLLSTLHFQTCSQIFSPRGCKATLVAFVSFFTTLMKLNSGLVSCWLNWYVEYALLWLTLSGRSYASLGIPRMQDNIYDTENLDIFTKENSV